MNGLGLTACLALAMALAAGSLQAGSGNPDDHIGRALAHPDRSAADRRRDETSKPAEVLRFLELQPGMVVFDMLGGGGYYSEIMARAVGPAGTVYLHNNQGYKGLMNRLPRRLGGADLDALEIYVREIADINLPSASVDLVLLVKVYHDLYYRNNGWNVAPDPVFDTIWRLLKPGGSLAVIDHAAPAGTGSTFAQNLHRIDPDFARRDIRTARLPAGCCIRAAGQSGGRPHRFAVRARHPRSHRAFRAALSADRARLIRECLPSGNALPSGNVLPAATQFSIRCSMGV